MFLVILAIAVILVLVVIYLPSFLGLSNVTVKRRNVGMNLNSFSLAVELNVKDTFNREFNVSGIERKLDKVSPNISLTYPFHSQESPTLRRRNVVAAQIDTDPNNFDYDIDDLVREDEEIEMANIMQQLAHNSESGKDGEYMV